MLQKSLTSIKKAFIFILLFTISFCLTSCSNTIPLPDDYNYEDLSQYLKLGDYKKIVYEKQSTEVTASEIKAEAVSILNEKASDTQVKSGTVESDSRVLIDYVGSQNGVEFDGGSAADTEVDIANSGFIPGFAEGLVGHKVGETFDVDVVFPENYSSTELAGKPAVFKMTVKAILVKEEPEYSDKWVKEHTDFSTVKALEESVKNDLTESKKEQAHNTEIQEILNQLLTKCDMIKVPELEYNAKYNSTIDYYKNYATQNDSKFEDFITKTMGQSLDEFYKSTKESTEKEIKTELIMLSIAKQENIKVSKKEYNSYINQEFIKNNYEANKENKQNYAKLMYPYYKLLQDKVMDVVYKFSIAK